MKRAYVDIPEGQVHYQFEGSGEPLLLLHQGMFSAEEFNPLIPLLSGRYKVIARDMLGYGMSDVNPPDYRVEDYARADISFMKALGIKKASFVGIHTGTKIAVELAVTHPEMVNKLVLYGVALYTAEEAQSRMKAYTFSPVVLKEDGSHYIDRYWKAARKFGGNARLPDLDRFVIAAAMASGGAYHGEQASFRYDMRQRLPLVKHPTLLVTGTGEPFMHQQMELVRSMMPDCRAMSLEGTDALVAREKPAELAQAILEFLKD